MSNLKTSWFQTAINKKTIKKLTIKETIIKATQTITNKWQEKSMASL